MARVALHSLEICPLAEQAEPIGKRSILMRAAASFGATCQATILAALVAGLVGAPGSFLPNSDSGRSGEIQGRRNRLARHQEWRA